MVDVKLIQGDCLDVMKTLPECSIDSIVTDPPYGLSFMGKHWDHGVPGEAFWVEALRVAKPGAHLLAFGGTRTFHRLAVAIEDAGWEIRDTIMWVYAQGFPKGMDIAWNLHKTACNICGIMVEYDYENEETERTTKNTEYNMRFVRATYLQTPVYACSKCGQVLQPFMSEQSSQELRSAWNKSETVWPKQSSMEGRRDLETPKGELQRCEICEMSHWIFADGAEGWLHNGTQISNGSIPWQITNEDGSCPSYRPQSIEQLNRQPDAFRIEREAQKFRGWNVALKPAFEPIIMARKPIKSTVAANVLEYGTGGINVDGCRVEYQETGEDKRLGGRDNSSAERGPLPPSKGWNNNSMVGLNTLGRTQGRFPANFIHDGSDEVVALFPDTKSGGKSGATYSNVNDSIFLGVGNQTSDFYGSYGSAARFFYCAKASKADRDEGLDSTRTIKYNCDKSILGGLSWKDVSTELVQLLQKVTSGLQTVKWNIGESGESITGRCQLASLSTTLMEINKITTSQILDLLMHSPTSVFIQDANCETVNGGNPVTFAESSNQLTKTTGISQKKDGHFTDAASLVISELLSKIKDEENWKQEKNFHSTVKPTALMRYLCKLVTQPGGVVLDPFMGSGSTGKAAKMEGFSFVGIELEQEYIEIAQRRIDAAKVDIEQPNLFA